MLRCITVTRDHICWCLWVKSVLKLYKVPSSNIQNLEKKLVKLKRLDLSRGLLQWRWYRGESWCLLGCAWECVHVVFINDRLQRHGADLANLLTEGQACLLGGLETRCKRWSKTSWKKQNWNMHKGITEFWCYPIPHLSFACVLVMWRDMEVFVYNTN